MTQFLILVGHSQNMPLTSHCFRFNYNDRSLQFFSRTSTTQILGQKMETFNKSNIVMRSYCQNNLVL